MRATSSTPQYAPGLPLFVPSFPLPVRIQVLDSSRQLPALREAAARGGVDEKLLYGAALQQLGHPRSAEQQFAAAARLAPRDADARTAAAVGLFDKQNPSRAFGRLGPLVRVFPHAQTVRFHLGEMLLWSAQVQAARRQLTLARERGPEVAAGQGGGEVPGSPERCWDPSDRKMSRSAYGVRPAAMRECRIPQRRVRNVTSPGGIAVSEQGERARPSTIAEVLETDEAKGLLEAGREAGSLSMEEIALALGELELDAAQVDDFYHALEEQQIEVVDGRRGGGAGRSSSRVKSRPTPCSSS